MSEAISYCGLVCDACPIYLATREKDDQKRHEMRVGISQQIKEHYGQDCKPEDVNDCDGCKADTGRLFSGCEKCETRKCARQKAVENCAHCPQYPCQNLQKLFATETDAKSRLDRIRGNIARIEERG